MTPNSDFDRLLEDWLDDGPLILSDRAFQNAMAIVDRTPQRWKWRVPWLHQSPAEIMAWGAASVVVVIIAAGLVVATLPPSTGGPPIAAPRELTIEQLREVLPQPDEAPPGTLYTEQLSGTISLSTIAGDADVALRWYELGAGETWHTIFQGGGQDWGAAAVHWPDADAASQALTAHIEVLPDQFTGERDLGIVDLGDEGVCLDYTANDMFGTPGGVCVFRVANATFFVPGSGAGVEPQAVVEMARTIATRAAATATESGSDQ
jgi:hypothetical protein